MKTAFLLIATVVATSLFAQTDDVGSGRAIHFDGVDDYIDLGNIYDDLSFPFTVSAWIYFNPGETGGPVFVSQDNSNLYKGFWFFVNPTIISIEYGDGQGGNNPAFRNGKQASLPNIQNRWFHACVVVNGVSNMDLYLNGQKLPTFSSGGASSLPMASNFPGDISKIGYFFSNGVVYRFRGAMDHIQLYNKALTETEIRQSMTQKLTGSEGGLIGHWTMNEISGNMLNDKSTKHYNGQLKGNPQRLFSGAPIGDQSKFIYPLNWTPNSITIDNLSVATVTGNPFGIHVYRVDDSPSQSQGLNPDSGNKPYYGVFVANSSSGNNFNVTSNADCAYSRNDNAQPLWSRANLSNIIDRVEILFGGGASSDVDLGTDVLLCNETSFQISTHVADQTDRSYLWNTGATTPIILVTQSGQYSVTVTEECSIERDTIQVTFQNPPPQFSLGNDEQSCSFKPRILQPNTATEGFSIQWQDGSSDKTFAATNYGTYWLILKNDCGESRDTVTYSKMNFPAYEIPPNVITPNGDPENEFFILDASLLGSQLFVYDRWGKQVYANSSYQNDWNGSSLTAGVYYYTLSGACLGDVKGTIQILR